MEQLQIGPLHGRNHPGIVVPAPRLHLEQVGGEHGGQGQGEDQGNGQGDGDGKGQGGEHLALHAFQGHQGQEHQNNDAYPENHRGGYLCYRPENGAHPAFPGLRPAQVGEGVFHHHHGTIHHEADGDGQAPQGHEVGGKVDLVHDHEGEQGGENQGAHHNDRGTDVPQEEEEDQHHQHHPFHEHLGDRMHRRIHQLGTVIVGDNLQAVREHALAVDFIHLGLDAGNDFLGVAAGDHHHHGPHGFGDPVFHHGPLAGGMTEGDIGHVPHVHGHPIHLLEDDGADVVQILHQAHPPD